MLNLLNNAKQKGQPVSVPDLCASYRKAVVDCLAQNFFRAAEETGARTLAVAGGVSANRLLRRRFGELCQQTGRRLYVPDLSLCGDNAAMVGAQAYFEYQAGFLAGMSLNACAAMDIAQQPALQGL